MNALFSLVGVGPGDPELLTLKAVRTIGAADVVAYPQTADGGTRAYASAAAHVPHEAERLPIAIPMEVEREPARAAYDAAASAILDRLAVGRSVAYLCEGDPLFYGSGMYLLDRIAGRARIEVVPGITSLTAAAGVIRRPLAARNEVLKVLPAPLPSEVLRAELSAAPAAAIIKVGRHFDRIRALLARTGHAERAIVIEHATTPEEKVTPLAEFTGDARPYFSTILCYRGDEAWGR